MSARARRVLGRAGWGVADQALSSLTNVLVSVLAARLLTPRGFGAFSLTFATYLLVLNATRGIAADPLAVRHSGVPLAAWRAGVAASTATAVLTGALLGAVCVGGAVIAPPGPTSRSFLVLGLVLPGLMLQDVWRYAFFAAGRGAGAFLNDLAWAVFLVPAMVVASRVDSYPAAALVGAWGGAATLAGLVGIAQTRVWPLLSSVPGWYRDHRDLGGRYVAENLGFSAATKLRLYGLGGLAGLSSVGALRGAEVLMGPANMLMMGAGGMMAIPEAARLARSNPDRMRPFCALIAAVFCLATLAWGGLFSMLGSGVGERLLGATWEAASPLLLPVTLAYALLGVWCGAWVGLRGLGVARRSLRAQAVGSAAFLVCALAGAAIAGAAGAAWGSALGNLVAVVAWWRQLHLALDELAATPGPSDALVPVPSP